MRNVSSGSSSIRSSAPLCRSRCSVAPSERRKPGRPAHLRHRVGEMLDAAFRRVVPPRGVAVADELQHRLAADEAVAVAALEAEEVRAAVVPVDRRPEEEDLRQRVLGRGRRRLADRAHAPRTVLRAVHAIERDARAPPAAMRPDHVPHCVMRVESITVFVPAVIVWRGSSSATVRAVNVTSASMPRSAASARTRVTRSGSTTSIVSGPMRVCAAIVGDAARREHRTLHAVVHDRERAVDDAAVRVHGHARPRSSSPRCSR